ncbi:MAG: peptidase domain protein [Deltaproteobacteria bacterium]|nr:peptidase domain protein [Deltaproteobacteria bacterium]
MFAKTILDNGIRIISQEMHDHRSVSLGIWVENGSRHESAPQNGISHFIEHLLFKGTERRSATQIAEEMDAVGGVLNAFTSKEQTCYYAKVLDDNLPLAIDLLTDIFLHSSFDPEEIERHDLFSLDFFKDHPIGRPICGRQETVKRFQRGDFVDFFKTRYRPSRVIVAAAGNFRHDQLVEEMAARLGMVGDGSEPLAALLDGERKPTMASGVYPHSKELEQVHLCLGMAGVAQSDPRRYPAYVLNTLLGGGMSSRLFQEIREKRGKAYSVYSFSSSYKDVGYLGVYAGTSIESAEEVVDLVVKELRKLAAGEITDEELARTRGQLVGGMMLGLESTDSWMSHIARNEIYFGKTVTTEEICQRIRAVSRDEVIQLADSLFHPEDMTLTLLGNFTEDFKLNSLAPRH